MTVTVPAPQAVAAPESASAAKVRRGLHLGMRWKLMLAFGIGFTIVFVVVAVWVVQFSTNTANTRVQETLRNISIGGATTIDATAFTELIALAPKPVPGEVYPSNSGYLAGTVATVDSVYPTSPLYWDQCNQIADIRRTNPEASPYTYFMDADGQMKFVSSWGALGYPTMVTDPPGGGEFLTPISTIVDPVTASYFAQGLVETTQQPKYTDALSTWISVYTPIKNAAGVTVGAIGVDYDIAYVNKVYDDVVRVLYPVLAVAYVVLLGLVYLLSGSLTRRLGRLSTATKRVSEGDYEVDLSSAAKSRIDDEMTELAKSFAVMTEKVGARERKLVAQVAVLKVEIDQKKRQQAVAEITDTDFFSELTAKADLMRGKVKADEAESARIKAEKSGVNDV